MPSGHDRRLEGMSLLIVWHFRFHAHDALGFMRTQWALYSLPSPVPMSAGLPCTSFCACQIKLVGGKSKISDSQGPFHEMKSNRQDSRLTAHEFLRVAIDTVDGIRGNTSDSGHLFDISNSRQKILVNQFYCILWVEDHHLLPY